MDLDDTQKKDFAAWKEALEAEQTTLTSSMKNLSEEIRLLRTRRSLLELVIRKNARSSSESIDEFRKNNIDGLTLLIKEKETKLDSLETEAGVRLAHLQHIISEIDSWIDKTNFNVKHPLRCFFFWS